MPAAIRPGANQLDLRSLFGRFFGFQLCSEVADVIQRTLLDPFFEQILFDPPLPTELEGRKLPFARQAPDGQLVQTKVLGNFGNGHDQRKIFFVHFRDVNGTPEKFEETWHDAGKTDMLACMQAYKEIDYEGVLRPDHVPTVEGDDNENAGYSSFGRLFALGYIQGLRQAVYDV